MKSVTMHDQSRRPARSRSGQSPESSTGSARFTLEHALTGVIAGLAAIAATIGLVRPALYRDAPIIVPQLLGQDLVTLVAGIPLLLVGAIFETRAPIRARLVWLGALGYLLYTYGTYALGARWNELFLVYVALFGLSLYAFILGITATDAVEVRASFAQRTPKRTIAFFLIGTAAVFALLWLSENVRALLAGSIPQTLVDAEQPTNIIHVFDLAVVLPALALAGVWLLRDQPWGYVLAGVLLVKAATLGLAVTAMGLFVIRTGMPAPLLPIFVFLTVASSALCWIYLRSCSEARPLKDGRL
jgi:hypothetical protein